MITCDCGACFEVAEAQPGQEVTCPECQHVIKVRTASRPPVRTSGLALASAVLALVGAFTLIGSAAAVVLGLFGLLHVLRQRERYAGVGLALFGILAGSLFTGVTVAVLRSPAVAALFSRARERSLASQYDTTVSTEDEVRFANGKCAITRPSEGWGRIRNNRADEPAIWAVQEKRDIVLLNAQRHAYIDAREHTLNSALPGQGGIDVYAQGLTEEFGRDWKGHAASVRGGEVIESRWEDSLLAGGGTVPRGARGARPKIVRVLKYGDEDLEGREVDVVVRRGGQNWHFLARVYMKREAPRTPPIQNPFGWQPRKGFVSPMTSGGPAPTVYLIRAYCPARRFEENEAELRKALDSFRLIGRPPTIPPVPGPKEEKPEDRNW
jgi:hypothetical protein